MPDLVKRPPPDELSQIRVLADFFRKYKSTSPLDTRSKWATIQRTISESAKALRLPQDRFWCEQDPDLRKRLHDSVCGKGTSQALHSFEDAWPLPHLFDLKVKRHRTLIGLDIASSQSGRNKQRKRLAKEKGHERNPPPPIQQGVGKQTERASIERFSPYPTAAARSSRGSLCIDLTRTSPQPGSSSHPITVESTPPSLDPPDLPVGSQMSFTSSQGTLVNTASSLSQIKRTEGAPPDEVFVGCCECGHVQPSHLSGPNTTLLAFLATEKKDVVERCLRALREGGMLSDAHLGVFLGWPVPCRRAFIDDLDTQELVKRKLRKLVHATISVEKHRATPTQPRNKIPPPVDNLAEDVLTDPERPLEFLLKAMDLPNNRGPFQEIVAAVKEGADDYMATYRPSRELFEAAVKEITSKNFSLFERYENQWLVRVILKRLARENKVKALDDHLSPLVSNPMDQASSSSLGLRYSQGSSSSSSIGASASQSPGIFPNISYTCPIHPGPDQDFVAPIVRRLLHSRGLAELIPVLALMGMPTEEDFNKFCELSVGKKDAVVNATNLKLSSFQRLALKLELWEGMLEGSAE